MLLVLWYAVRTTCCCGAITGSDPRFHSLAVEMTNVGGDVSLRLRDHGALALPAHTHSRRRTPHSNKVQHTASSLRCCVVPLCCQPGPLLRWSLLFTFCPYLSTAGSGTHNCCCSGIWLLNAPPPTHHFCGQLRPVFFGGRCCGRRLDAIVRWLTVCLSRYVITSKNGTLHSFSFGVF